MAQIYNNQQPTKSARARKKEVRKQQKKSEIFKTTFTVNTSQYSEILKYHTQDFNAASFGTKEFEIKTSPQGFIEKWDEIVRDNEFIKLRMQLERILTDKGKAAMSISLGSDNKPIINSAEVKESYMVNNKLAKVVIVKHGYEYNGNNLSVKETYNLKTMMCERDVYPNIISGLTAQQLDGIPNKWSFRDLGIIPVKVFSNDDVKNPDYANLEELDEAVNTMFVLYMMNAKMSIPRIIYNTAVAQTDADTIESALLGTTDELKAFIQTIDSDQSNTNPYNTLNPANNIDKTGNALDNIIGQWRQFAKLRKEVSDKGTVQQSTTEIAEMNSFADIYIHMKEMLRKLELEGFLTILQKFCSVYLADYSGDKEAFIEIDWSDDIKRQEMADKLAQNQQMLQQDDQDKTTAPNREQTKGTLVKPIKESN